MKIKLTQPNFVELGLRLSLAINKGNTQAKNNNNNKDTKNNKTTMGNKATIPVKNNMYYQRASPLFIYEINSKSIMANDLLKRAISNAFRHDLNLRPGHLNNADGNCLWEAIIFNILYRACFRKKTKETHKQLRKRSLDNAQIDAQNNKLPFIESNTSQAEWNQIRQDKIYETDLGDICIVAASRAIKKDIMVFNTNKKLCNGSNNTNMCKRVQW